MKTSSKIIVALAASIVIGAILVCIGVGVYIAWMRRSTKYTLTPEQTVGMFSKTPEEFIINPRPTTESGNGWLGKIFCKSAKMKGNGDLVFALTEQQKKSWRSSQDLQKRVNIARRNENITIAGDYTSMTVRCTRETASELVAIADNALPTFYCNLLLDGVKPADIAVAVTFVDAVTGETVYTKTVTLPDPHLTCDPALFTPQPSTDQ